MSSHRRSLAAIAASFTLLSGFAIAGCQQESPAGPSATDATFAKGGGGGKGPRVNSTDPPSAPLDITLDVRVLGSGFDDGSGVTLTINGNSQPKVRTNSTTFVSESELVANVTIDADAIVDLYDVEVLTFRGKRGVGADLFSVKKKGDSFSYTITDLGTEGGVSDINDAGLIVGGSASGRAARWIDTGGGYSMELLGDGVWESGPGSWAAAVNASGDAVGYLWVDAAYTDRAALWSSVGVELLPLLDPAHELSQAYGINDLGQISGQSYTRDYDIARAVRWEPDDGSVTDLGVLPGYDRSIGWALNDLGWVAGTSRPAGTIDPVKRQHAVLWIDDGSGQISAPVDLHEFPEIPSIAWGISDVSTDGKVYIAGVLPNTPVVWEVDVTTHAVIEHVLAEVSGGAGAVNAAGEVVVSVSGPAVWTLATGLLEPLPGLSSKPSCSSDGRGRGINNVGTVVGRSSVFAKGRCVQHLVVWTKIN